MIIMIVYSCWSNKSGIPCFAFLRDSYNMPSLGCHSRTCFLVCGWLNNFSDVRYYYSIDMRVVHAKYSLENSVFSGVNIISVIEYFFWQGFDRNEAGHYFGNCKGFSFQVNMSKNHGIDYWNDNVLCSLKCIRCEIVKDFLTRTGPESTTLRQCSCGEKKWAHL